MSGLLKTLVLFVKFFVQFDFVLTSKVSVCGYFI